MLGPLCGDGCEFLIQVVSIEPTGEDVGRQMKTLNETFLEKKDLRALLLLTATVLASGCAGSTSRGGSRSGGALGSNGLTCARSMVGEWQMVRSEPAAPSRGPSGLEAFEHL